MEGTKRSWAYSWVYLSAIMMMIFLSTCAGGRYLTSTPRKDIGFVPSEILNQEKPAQGLKSPRAASKESDAATQARVSETYGFRPPQKLRNRNPLQNSFIFPPDALYFLYPDPREGFWTGW